MLMVAVKMLAALFLAQSSSPSSHSIAPFHFQKTVFPIFLIASLLIVGKLGHGIAIERAVIEDTACGFKPTLSIYERVVATVGDIDAIMANLVI